MHDWVLVDGYDFCITDNEHNRMIDVQGLPASKSLTYAPMLLRKCIQEIQEASGLTVALVTAGQGLMKMIPALESHFNKPEARLSSVVVAPATHSYADLKETETDVEAMTIMEAQTRASGAPEDVLRHVSEKMLALEMQKR